MTKFLEKANKLDQKINCSLIHEQVKEMRKIDHYVSEERPLPVAPKKLGLLPDEFEGLLEKIGENKRKQLTDINNLLNNFRQYLSLKYGIWSIANLETAKLIKDELKVKTALEIMAGNAYWSQALEEAGIKTISTDSLEWAKTSKTGSTPFHQVIDLSADQAIAKYDQVDLVLCSWSPNFGKSDIKTVKSWQNYNKNSHLLFIGERDGATNSPEFWSHHWFKKTSALSIINHSFRSFDFINERIFEINNEL